MYLEEVIIDGFKSYAQCTKVSPFDRSFTAITGLNGSGKSNILDAICFVLGMTQLKSIRVQQMTDLIYKQGQAGITKASVSLVFDNKDEATSPQGYEHCKQLVIVRQILANGQTRYLLNDQVAKQKSIKQLFHSIGLNINNPNFLIQQGRIGQILASRPQELLSILEETAGTSMYDANRKDAMKIFEQKQLRLNQIRKTISEEIKPRIEKLDSERKIGVQIAALQKSIKSLEILKNLGQINQNLEQVDRIAARRAELEKRETKLRQEYLGQEQELVQKNEEFAVLQRSVQQQEQASQEVQAELKHQLEQLQTQLAVFQNQQQNNENKIKENEQNIKKKDAHIQKIAQKKQQLQKDIEAVQKSGEQQRLVQLNLEMQNAAQEKQRLESELDLKKTGTVDGSYLDQFQMPTPMLEELKNDLFEGEYLSVNEIFSRLKQLCIVQDGTANQAVSDLAALKQQLAKLQQQIGETARGDQELQRQVQMKRDYLQTISSNVAQEADLNFTDVQSIDEFVNQLRKLIQQKREQLKNVQFSEANNIKNQQTRIEQQYQSFIRACQTNRGGASVYNMVKNLPQQTKQKFGIRGCVLDHLLLNDVAVSNFMNSSKIQLTQLLNSAEKAAGMRLFNIVATETEAASQFLKSQFCTTRATVLPIDNVKALAPNKQKLQALHQYGGVLLYELFSPSDPELQEIFSSLFGNIALAPTLDHARNIAYNKDCGIRCFTFDGDVVDPFGVVSGGSSKSNSGNIIQEFLQLKQLQDSKVERRQSQMLSFDEGFVDNLQSQLQNIIKAKQAFDEAQSRLSSEGKTGMLQRKYDDISRQLQTSETLSQKETERLQSLNAILQQIAEAAQNAEKSQQNEQQLLQDISNCSQHINKLQQEIDKLKQTNNIDQIEAKQMEIYALEQELQTHVFAREQYEAQIRDYVENDRNRLTAQVAAAEAASKEVQDRLFNQEIETSSQSKEISNLKSVIKQLEESYQSTQQRFHAATNQLKELSGKCKSQEEQLIQLLESVGDCMQIFEQLFVAQAQQAARFKARRRAQQLSLKYLLQSMVDGGLVSADTNIVQLDDQACAEIALGYLENRDVERDFEETQKQLVLVQQQQSSAFSSTTANLEELQKNSRNLIQMEEKLQADRDKILDMIQRVDERKAQALEELYHDVNENLGNIFSILLPNAFAQLEKVDQQSIEKGIQFHVKLGETRTNLSGLSGGQKSLLALGFTLSLLKCRPSPIYILDEIDAALDLSHTHHIGQLIAEQFKDSQFIIVSLKEGMFNHANRLFRVKFVDGMSRVYQEKGGQ